MLSEVIRSSLERDAKSTDQVLADCRRRGLKFRDQTVVMFLRLSHQVQGDGVLWKLRSADRVKRIVKAAEKAFAAGGTYVPLQKLVEQMDEGDEMTIEEITRVCEEETGYRVRGGFIVKQ